MIKRKFKNFFSVVLVLVLVLQMFPIAANVTQFSDVPSDHWAYESITFVIAKGYMGETQEGLFEPDATASRGMIITALYRLAGKPEVDASNKPFSDVELGIWYSEPIIWAKSIGIVDGHDDGTFRPENAMPREQIALIMWRYAQILGYDTGTVGSDYDKFSDFDDTPIGCQPAMRWAIKKDMLIGRQDGNLHPNAAATRAELATCLCRFVTNNRLVTGISFATSEQNVDVGWRGVLDVNYTPNIIATNLANTKVTWTSSDPYVADIDSAGNIVAKRAGRTTISATTVLGTYSTSCTLIVNQCLTYPDTLITNDSTRQAIIRIKTLRDENEKAYLKGEVSDANKAIIDTELDYEYNIVRADYIASGTNPTSDYAYIVLGGDRNSTIPSSFSKVLELNSTGLEVFVVQRTLEVMGYYEPDSDQKYGTFDQKTYDAANVFNSTILSAVTDANGNTKHVFDDLSFNVLFQASTVNQRTFESYNMLNQRRVVHDEVVRWTAAKIGDGATIDRKSNKIYYGSSHANVGYADILKDTGDKTYLWEIKPDELYYTENYGLGQVQVGTYMAAGNDPEISQNFTRPLVNGYNVGEFTFMFMGKYINVRSFVNPDAPSDARNALVVYKYDQPRMYELETVPVPVEEPSYAQYFQFHYDFDSLEYGFEVICGIVIISGSVYVAVQTGGVVQMISLMGALMA